MLLNICRLVVHNIYLYNFIYIISTKQQTCYTVEKFKTNVTFSVKLPNFGGVLFKIDVSTQNIEILNCAKFGWDDLVGVASK